MNIRVSMFERCGVCSGTGVVRVGDWREQCEGCQGTGESYALTDLGKEVARVVELVLRERERKAKEEACNSKVTEK